MAVKFFLSLVVLLHIMSTSINGQSRVEVGRTKIQVDNAIEEYYDLLAVGEYYLLKGEYDKAWSYINDAKNKYNFNKDGYILYALIATQNNYFSSASTMLSWAAVYGYEVSYFSSRMGVNKNYINSNEYKQLVKESPALQKLFVDSLDKEFETFVDKLSILDQYVRLNEKSLHDCLPFLYYNIDSTTRQEILSYLSTHKLPKVDKATDETWSTFSAMVKHIAPPTLEQLDTCLLIKLLKGNLAQDRLPGEILAGIYDYTSLRKTNKQIYGTFRDRNFNIIDVQDRTKVDSLRRSVHLLPMGLDYAPSQMSTLPNYTLDFTYYDKYIK
jgi:hypothetical protein